MDRPVVTVLTPVYNGEAYLAKCIESVLSQDYADFEYNIIDNCSTDGSLEIARSYERKDRRVKVTAATVFVSAIENHNRAFSLVPDYCRYCKLVSADDWILPNCIHKMVAFAEAHPSVGIVASYQRSGDDVKWRGVPPAIDFLPGRDAARLGLMDSKFVFGPPTSVLYRADQVRKHEAFFPHLMSWADTSACYEVLRNADAGFLHEVLSEERVHSGQWTAKMDAIDAGSVGYVDVLLRYGPVFLSSEEFARRKEQVFAHYYRCLGGSFWKLKGRDYWRYHRSRLTELGVRWERARIARAAMVEAMAEAKEPMTAMKKVIAVLRGAHC